MKKTDIQLLIVEDDKTVGKALELAMQKAGYQTKWMLNSNDAEKAARLHDFQCAIIDCMIPGKNGLVLAEKLKKENQNLNIFLTSGIFKDRQYVQDALQRTQAIEFFKKPFSIEDIIKKVDSLFTSDDELSSLNKLLGLENFSLKDRINSINNTSPVNALDLPHIYSLLIDGKATGQLKIEYPNSGTSVIGFNEGLIDEVNHFDKDSYFGVLLIEKGFITSEELEIGLATQNNKRIGEKLVDINTLSPHAIHIVQVEQMKIRLSKTITNASVEVSFLEEERQQSSDTIDALHFSYSLNDWIQSKISHEWLSSFYRVWFEHPICLGPNASKFNLLAGLPIIKKIPKLIKDFEEYPHSLNDLISKYEAQETEILEAVHLLLLERVIYFGAFDETKTTSHEVKHRRLQKIKDQFQGQNYFEILGLSSDARSIEINRAYHELAKALHPDKIGPKEHDDIKLLSEEIFATITQAFQVLKTPASRKQYERELKMGKAEDILKMESNFTEGQHLLFSGKYSEAYSIFADMINNKSARSDTPIFYCWARIKNQQRTQRDLLAVDIKTHLEKVPHEDRHNKYYFFVKGLYYNLVRNHAKAYSCFKHSLAMDPQFKDARREMSLLKRNINSPSGVTETTTIIGRLFGIAKKKSG